MSSTAPNHAESNDARDLRASSWLWETLLLDLDYRHLATSHNEDDQAYDSSSAIGNHGGRLRLV
jgi:hypothetical protein